MDIDQWRRCIGLFSVRRVSPQGMKGPPTPIHGRSILKLDVSCSLSRLAIVFSVIGILLLVAGDVEANPGPGEKREYSLTALTPAPPAISQLGNERGRGKILSIRVFREYYPRLSAAIESCVNYLEIELLSGRVISVEATNEILATHGHSPAHKSIILMSEIGYAIAGDSSGGFLKKMCEMMKTDPHLKSLGEEMTYRIAELEEEQRKLKDTIRRRSQSLLDCLYKKMKSWLNGKDKAIEKVKEHMKKGKEIHKEAIQVRRAFGVGSVAVGAIATMLLGGLNGLVLAILLMAVFLGLSGEHEKREGDKVLRSVACVIIGNKSQCEEVNVALRNLKEYYIEVHENKELPFQDLDFDELFTFFRDWFKCSEKDIQQLVDEAQEMSAMIVNIPRDELHNFEEYLNYVVNVASLSINIYDYFSKESSVEGEIKQVLKKMMNDCVDLRNLILFLETKLKSSLVTVMDLDY